MATNLGAMLGPQVAQAAPASSPGIGQLVQPAPFAPQAPRSPQEKEQIAAGWREALRRPEMQAALLQFGISMLNPVSPGGNTIANIGSAFGQAGEAVGRVRTADAEAAAAAAESTRKNFEAETGRMSVEQRREAAKLDAQTAVLNNRETIASRIQQKGLELDQSLLESILKAQATEAGRIAENAALLGKPVDLNNVVDMDAVLSKYQQAIADRDVRNRVSQGQFIPTTSENIKLLIQSYGGNPQVLNQILSHYDPAIVAKARKELQGAKP